MEGMQHDGNSGGAGLDLHKIGIIKGGGGVLLFLDTSSSTV